MTETTESRPYKRKSRIAWGQLILVAVVSAVIGATSATVAFEHRSAGRADEVSTALKDMYWGFCTERGHKWQNDVEAKKLCQSVWKNTKMVSLELGVPINPMTAIQVMAHESRFCTMGFGQTGDTGCFQINKSWGRYPFGCDVMERECNIYTGLTIFGVALKKFSGDEKLALAAYNRGDARVIGLLKSGSDPHSNGYAKKVLGV